MEDKKSKSARKTKSDDRADPPAFVPRKDIAGCFASCESRFLRDVCTVLGLLDKVRKIDDEVRAGVDKIEDVIDRPLQLFDPRIALLARAVKAVVDQQDRELDQLDDAANKLAAAQKSTDHPRDEDPKYRPHIFIDGNPPVFFVHW